MAQAEGMLPCNSQNGMDDPRSGRDVTQDARIKVLEGTVAEARAQVTGAVAAAQSRGSNAVATMDAAAADSRLTALAAASGEVGNLQQGAALATADGSLSSLYCAANE
jgi:hypothetical protein